MAGRIESETKKTAFIEACENLDQLKVVPEKLLQSQRLLNFLSMDEIDTTMLYKCGCPCDWVKEATIECNKKPLKPSYSNECASCWFYNLTEEVDVDIKKEEYDLKEVLRKYREYESLKLTPEQLKEILTLLGWYEIEDYGLLHDTIEDMQKIYKTKK